MRKDAPATAAKISNPAAKIRNGELRFFRLRSDSSVAIFKPPDGDMLLPGYERSKVSISRLADVRIARFQACRPDPGRHADRDQSQFGRPAWVGFPSGVIAGRLNVNER
jgi:hypothetical protein